MNIYELRRLADKDKNSFVRLYNPLLKDFSVNFNDGSGVKAYTLKAKEIEQFSLPVANHIRKHLVDFIINEREVNTLNEDAVNKIKQEIEVQL